MTIELRGLQDRAEAFRTAELYRRWLAFPPLARWHAQSAPAWEKMSAEFAKELGSSAEELIVELLGREAVLAVWPGAGAIPGEPPTLLLVRAADGPFLNRLVDRVCDAQQRAGAVRAARAATHAGIDYRVQVIERDGRQTPVCFAVFDDVGVLTGSEDILRAVLELRAADAGDVSLDSLPAHRAASERIAPESVLRVFVNPRSWDEQFSVETMPADDRWLGDAWRAAEYFVASLEVGERTAIESHIEFAPERLTPALRETLASLSGGTQFLDRVPANALLAVTGRTDVPRLVRALVPRPQPGEPDPAALFLAGWTWISQSLGGLGPEAGACLLDATGESRQDAPPFDWILAARVNRNVVDGRPARTPDELHIALRSALTLAAEAFNAAGEGRHVAVDAVEADADKLLSVSNVPAVPPGMTPTFLAAGGWLWGASSPALLRQVAAENAAEAALAESAAIASLASPRLDPGHVLYADLRGLRRLIERHRQALLAQAEENRGMNPRQARQSLEQLLSLLQLADFSLVAGQVSERGVSLSIAVSAQPESVP